MEGMTFDFNEIKTAGIFINITENINCLCIAFNDISTNDKILNIKRIYCKAKRNRNERTKIEITNL